MEGVYKGSVRVDGGLGVSVPVSFALRSFKWQGFRVDGFRYL